MTLVHTTETDRSAQLPILAVLAALLAFLALLYASYVAAGGVFEYPLDDPYIHMAMAEQMRAGGYGVNAGEYAAASSSPLFSVLLMPFAGEPAQRLLPLYWNIAGLIAAAWLWGRILWQAGYGGSVLGMGLALIGPVALNMMGLAFTGMEHMLHVAASLAIVSGLLTFLDTGRIGKLLLLGIFLTPLMRFEGLALAILAALVVMVRGRFSSGLVLLVLAIAPIAGFSYFLTTLGLEPLPSSVTAKLGIREGETQLLSLIIAKVQQTAGGTRQLLLAGFVVVAAILAVLKPVRASGRWPLLFAVGGAGVAHLIFGRYGWMNRYEIYILVIMAAGLLAVSAGTGRKSLPLLALIPILFTGAYYVPRVIEYYPGAARAIHLQQAQMSRLAKDYLKEPVAVNDLGWVAWRNPDYVLDLWGLANHEARRLRLQNPGPGWADELTDARGVKVAMIYREWFGDAIGDDWVLLGELTMTGVVRYLGGRVVGVYLTGPAETAPYLAALRDWQAGLPEGANFEFSDAVLQ